MNEPKVLIVGGGFAGLSAARALAKHKKLKITLVDRRNHHLFQPLLYQVATAGLSPADIATPIRHVFSNESNITVFLDEVVGISPTEKQVQLSDQKISYDYLILACGANHSYFGHPEWEEFAPGLKTVEQATEIRRRILTAFEQAEKETDLAKQAAWMTFVIVGAGPTGVELAGAIAELSQYTILKEFRNIDPAKAKIIVIEAGPKVLAQFDEKLGERAHRDLSALKVNVQLSTRVTKVNAEGVNISAAHQNISATSSSSSPSSQTPSTASEKFIAAKTVLWAAGVAPSKTGKELAAHAPSIQLDSSGRVIVNSDLSVNGFPNIFVLGDQAHFNGPNGKPLPGLAPVAIQQGKHVAKTIQNLMNGKPALPFHYFDKGQMATIGRSKAVAQTGKLKMEGLIAWLAWLVIHIYYIIGFRNRLFVFLQWMWSYLTFSRGARLIVGKDWHLKG